MSLSSEGSRGKHLGGVALAAAGKSSRLSGRLSGKGKGEEENRFLAAVTKLQRAYRLSSFVYRHFGPELFVDSRGFSASASPSAPTSCRSP